MKPHATHDFTNSAKCLRCSEYVLSLDAKLPCRPLAIEPVTSVQPAPLWDADDPDVMVEF